MIEPRGARLAGSVDQSTGGHPAGPTTVANPLAVGVLLDGRIQDRWVLESLRQALAVPGVRLAQAAIVRGRGGRSPAALLHAALDGIDRRLRCRNEPLFAPVDVVAELGVAALDVPVLHGDGGWYPDDDGLAALRRGNVDLWLCFAATPPQRPMPGVSRIGVWGIEIGRGVPACNRWAGAQELRSGSPVTLARVVDYANADDGVDCRAYSATVTNSARNNRLCALRLCLPFFGRLLRDLSCEGRLRAAAAPGRSQDHGDSPGTPTLAAVTQASWRVLATVTANRWRHLHSRDQWQIAYHFADGDVLDHRRLRYLVPPKDRFWADPFPVEHRGRYFIFFEELCYRDPRGRIAVIEVFEHREPTEPRLVLERPYHLSYPFIFNWQGSCYLLPESGQNRTVELYRCESFPLRWRLHKVLLSGISAFDGTLWRANDRWWMFVNVAPPGTDGNDELHLYSSSTPFGPWAPHRRNPVVSDVRCARSAGPLFSRDGVLYRPSQDCSVAYGHSVGINRVEVLDDDDFRQTPVQRIMPGWRRDILRVHSYAASGRLRAIDYLVRRRRWSVAWPERIMHAQADGQTV